MTRQTNTGGWGYAAATVMLLFGIYAATADAAIVVDFEDLAEGTEFLCGDEITIEDVHLRGPDGAGRGFCMSRGSIIESVMVEGDPRHVLQFDSRDIVFDFGTDLTDLSLTLVNPDELLRITVNAESDSSITLDRLDGLQLGGVSISTSVPGANLLRIDFSGSIERFVFGSGRSTYNQILE